MQEKSFTIENAAGLHRIAYTEWGKVSSRPPVICVHGLTRNGRDFDALARVLAENRKVFCPDIPGRGKSEWFEDPANYNYGQYIVEVMGFIAHIGASEVDWVGTSMGGIIGMLLAAQENTPIKRMVVNDVGPFIPLAALKRIGGYITSPPEFNDAAAVGKYLRQIYSSFGVLSDADWQHLAAHGTRKLPNGKLALSYDPAIANAFQTLEKDVDFWEAYDQIKGPLLLLRGMKSDILPADVAEAMTRRGPKAQLVEFPRVGHAPALMDPTQIEIIAEFLD